MAAQQSEQGFTVEVRARNLSASTAASVEVAGTLKENGQTVEAARTVFDYLPGHSTRRGGLSFRRDLRGLDFEVRPLGYTEP